ncbi:MAG TPA: TlpA disulfide reductase family protein [Polyangiaceae bacterium]|nr:TlpA disulfide reductase family protein [Polyangiaceae bacterium]
MTSASRWASLGALGAFFTLGCDEPASAGTASHERSQAVLAAPGSAASAPAPSAVAATAPGASPSGSAKPARHGPLCASKPGGKLPDRKVGGRGARGVSFAGGKPAAGQATWVNLWAAWCEPCKKELPLLHDFQRRAKADGVPFQLAFFSLDDDERQLQRFLDSPNAGLDHSFWLREGDERENWLADARLTAEPRLPVHLLVGADGEIFCRVDGSIEAEDYAAALELLRSHL